MTCDRALEALLDADLPDVLTGRAPLAVHVRDCRRCRAVAQTLATDTQMLAHAVALAPRRPGRSPLMIALPAAAAAVLLVMVTTQDTVRAPGGSRISALEPVVVQPAAPVAQAPEPAPVRATPRAFPRANPVMAVKLDAAGPANNEASLPASSTTTVTVAPPAGTRAVVMQTGDPRLVVVWLY